jgi:hypothetical protein
MCSFSSPVLSREHLVGPANRCAYRSPDLHLGAAPGVGHPYTTIGSVPADTCIPSSDNLSQSAIPRSPNGSTDFGSSIAAALTPLLRLHANAYNPDPTQPNLPSPSSLDLLHMLMRPLSLSQLSAPYLPAEHPPAIFVFGTHRAPSPRLQPGSTSPARRRARVRRTAYRMATKLNPIQPLDDWSPDTSAVTLAPRLKRVCHDPPSPARVASPAVRQWLDPSSPNWGDPPPVDGAIFPDKPCWFRPSTPPFPPPDSSLADVPVLPEEHRWPRSSPPPRPLPPAPAEDAASPPPLPREPRPPSSPGASPATPHVDTFSWLDTHPYSPSLPPPDSPPAVAYVSHEVLHRFGLDPPVDMSAWPDYPPSSPSWAPSDPPPAYVPVPIELLHRLRLQSPCPEPPLLSLPDAAESIAGTCAGPPPPGSTPPSPTTSSASPHDAYPPPRHARSPSPGSRPPKPGGRSPPLSAGRTSARTNLSPVRPTHHFDDTGRLCLSQDDEALRLSTLEVLTTLLDAKAAEWNAELAELRVEVTSIRDTIRGSLHTSPEQLAHIQAIDTEVTLRTSAWQSSHAAIKRAILDLKAADTPSSAFDAVNSATILLELPAAALLASASPAPISPGRTSSRPGSPARPIHLLGDYSGDVVSLSDDDWEALRISTLDAIGALVYSTEDRWGAEHAQLHEEFMRLRNPISGSRTPSSERQARIRALSTRITLRTSAWKSYRADLRRAILDLSAANTSALASAAVQAATLLLAAPAAVLPASASPMSTPEAEPPLPLPDDTTNILSGRLVFPNLRVPRAATQHSSHADSPTRATHAPDPGHSLSRRFPSPSPTLAARTSKARNVTLVPRRVTDQQTRASTPQPADLQWACKHRSCASIRPPPTRPTSGPPRPATPAHVAPSPAALDSAAARCPTPARAASTIPPRPRILATGLGTSPLAASRPCVAHYLPSAAETPPALAPSSTPQRLPTKLPRPPPLPQPCRGTSPASCPLDRFPVNNKRLLPPFLPPSPLPPSPPGCADRCLCALGRPATRDTKTRPRPPPHPAYMASPSSPVPRGPDTCS